MVRKKFVLNKETVRHLSEVDMSQAMGAGETHPSDPSCSPPTESDCDDNCVYCSDANKTSS